MADYCPTCGHLIRVVTGGEGTSHYEPVENDREKLREVRDRLRAMPRIDCIQSEGRPSANDRDHAG